VPAEARLQWLRVVPAQRAARIRIGGGAGDARLPLHGLVAHGPARRAQQVADKEDTRLPRDPSAGVRRVPSRREADAPVGAPVPADREATARGCVGRDRAGIGGRERRGLGRAGEVHPREIPPGGDRRGVDRGPGAVRRPGRERDGPAAADHRDDVRRSRKRGAPHRDLQGEVGRGVPQAQEDQERVREGPVGRAHGEDRGHLHDRVPRVVAPGLRAHRPAADARRRSVRARGQSQSLHRVRARDGERRGESGDELRRVHPADRRRSARARPWLSPWCGRPQKWRYDGYQNICPHCSKGVDDWMDVCPWCGEDATGRDLIRQALRRVRQLLVVSRLKDWNYRVLLRPGVSGVTHRSPKVIEIERRYVTGKRWRDEISWNMLTGLILHELGHSFLYHNWSFTRTGRFRRAFGEVRKVYRVADSKGVDFERRGVTTTLPNYVTAYAATHPQEDFAETFR